MKETNPCGLDDADTINTKIFNSLLSKKVSDIIEAYQNNVWVCFIVRHDNQFIVYGFIRAKYLNMKRYFSVHQLRDLPIINLNDWIDRLKRKRK